jgi:hypothetical protein
LPQNSKQAEKSQREGWGYDSKTNKQKARESKTEVSGFLFVCFCFVSES